VGIGCGLGPPRNAGIGSGGVDIGSGKLPPAPKTGCAEEVKSIDGLPTGFAPDSWLRRTDQHPDA